MRIAKDNLTRNFLLWLLAASMLIITVTYLSAQETVACPTPSPCKVLILSEEQVQALDQLVSNTAIQGPYAQVHQVVQFYKDMLANAPAGKPKVEPKPEPKK